MSVLQTLTVVIRHVQTVLDRSLVDVQLDIGSIVMEERVMVSWYCYCMEHA